MRKDVVLRSCMFAAGVFTLEGCGSLLHALVLRDIPPELAARGVDLRWMLSRDVLLAILGGIAFAGASLLLPAARAASGRVAGAFGLGVAFALALEIANWAFPGALLDPDSFPLAVIAWSCFAGGALLAAHLSGMRARGA